MTSIRRLITMGLVCATVVTMTSACSLFERDTDTAAAAASDLRQEVGQEPQILTVWASLLIDSDQGAAALNAVARQFEAKYPQVTVKVVAKTDADIATSLSAASSTATPSRTNNSGVTLPDIVTLQPGAATQSLSSSLLPLQSSLSDTAAADLRYLDDSYAADGNLYAVPIGSQAIALASNPELLAKANVPADSTKTFSGLLEACTALQAIGIEPFDVAWLNTDDLAAFIGLFATQVSTRAQIRGVLSNGLPTDNVATAFSYVQQMQQAGCFGDASYDRPQTEELNAYAGGRSGFFLVRSAQHVQRIFAAQPRSVLSQFPDTELSKHRQISYGGPVTGFGITKSSANKAAGGAFLTFLSTAGAQSILYREAAIVPNLRSFVGNPVSPAERAYAPLASKIANVSVQSAWPVEVLNYLSADAPLLLRTNDNGASVSLRVTQLMRPERALDTAAAPSATSSSSGN